MNIHLPEHLERYVHDQVQSGRYLTEDEVIRDALERHRQAQEPPANTTRQPDMTPEAIADQELQRRLLEAGIISEIKFLGKVRKSRTKANYPWQSSPWHPRIPRGRYWPGPGLSVIGCLSLPWPQEAVNANQTRIVIALDLGPGML
jgi:putative addiction module CopG family antidote